MIKNEGFWAEQKMKKNRKNISERRQVMFIIQIWERPMKSLHACFMIASGLGVKQNPLTNWALDSEPGSIFWWKKRVCYWYLGSWDLSRSIRLEKWCRTVVEFLHLLQGATKRVHFRFFPSSLSSAQHKTFRKYLSPGGLVDAGGKVGGLKAEPPSSHRSSDLAKFLFY